MPIKLPKGFPRRKSSGNALEENTNPPQPSFRVFERTPDGRKSFDGATALKRMMEDNRPVSDGQYQDYEQGGMGPLNRGSGGTQNSASTGGPYDASSSARFGSSSTLPSSSSLDAAHDALSHAHPKAPQKAAVPSGFSLRAAGRTFSFGARKTIQPTVPSPDDTLPPLQHAGYSDLPAAHHTIRPRAMTELSHASGSTATPPKLLDTDFGEDGEDGFGDIFAGVGAEKRRSRLEMQKEPGRSNPTFDLYTPNRTGQPPPAPIHLNRSDNISPAPYSGDSQNSHDVLISASPQQEASPFNHRTPNSAFSTSDSQRITPNTTNSSDGARANYRSFRPQPQWQVPGERSPKFLDDDTRLAMQYMGASDASSGLHNKRPEQNALGKSISGEPQPRPVTLYDGENQDNREGDLARHDSISTTPRAKKATLDSEEDTVVEDLDFQEMVISADRFQTRSESPPPRRPPPPKSQGKVMTPAQFERYKKEQESIRNQYAANKSDSEDEDGDGDKYEDDDEEERNKEMARQRRRQDAQMSVYRQQMMKVTGEQPLLNAATSRPGLAATISGIIPGPNERFMDGKADDDDGGDDDDDDEIPLGILAAHGFPSKERPPTHLNRMSSQPNIRYTSETYPPPVASASGASIRESGVNMPAFARNLPKDPFFGAGLVNPTDRQSFALGAGSQSVYGGSQAVATPNPGGLVGVIAKEERARALRRGSPNAATFDMSNGMAPASPNMMGGGPGQDQQAQMQMSQQMTQMMQMQMQWMQQMMQMQGMQGQQTMPGQAIMPGMPPMPGFPMQQMPGAPQMNMIQVDLNSPRPTSMGNMSNTGPQMPQLGSRSMSMLVPDSQAWNPRNGHNTATPSLMAPTGRNSAMSQTSFGGPVTGVQHAGGYAPSLAPSERSNIGLAPRYRPVSTMPGADGSGRASTMGSSALNAWEGNGKGKAAATVRVVPSKKRDEDEDEDEGWEEMRKKREKKRSLWRGRKSDKVEQHGLDDVFIPSMD